MIDDSTIKLSVGFVKSDGSRFTCNANVQSPNVMLERAMWNDTNVTDEHWDASVDAMLADCRLYPITPDTDDEPTYQTLDATRID